MSLLGSLSDRDIVECLQNCPELDDPLFDENVLNELCLSDELWSNLNMPPMATSMGQEVTSASTLSPVGTTEAAASMYSPAGGYDNKVFDIPGLTPPQSPPTPSSMSSTSLSASATSVAPPATSVAPPVLASSSTYPSSAPPSTASSSTPVIASLVPPLPSLSTHSKTTPTSITAPPPSSVSSQQASPPPHVASVSAMPLQPQPQLAQQQHLQEKGAKPGTSLAQVAGSWQILKSGEIVYLPPALSGLLQQVTQAESNNKGNTKQEMKPEAVPTVSTGQKRQHPDSGSAAAASTASVDASKLSKKQLRMMKNRESACNSRLRRRQYIESLEARLKDAAQKNSNLLQQNTTLRKQVSLLEKENETLRLSMSRPASPAQSSPMKRPAAAILAVAILFVSLSAVFFYPRDQGLSGVSFPLAHTSTALTSIKSRALLSIDTPEQYQPPSAPHISSRGRNNRNTPAAANGGSALILGEQVVRNLRNRFRLGGFVGGQDEGGHQEEPAVRHVCSCPLETGRNGSMRHNQTNIQRINKNMMSCFDLKSVKVPPSQPHEDVQFATKDKDQNSLTIVSTGYPLRTPADYLFQGADSLYREFKKYIPRNLENYYLLSFKEHILLQPTMGNSSQLPMLSVFIPADSDFSSLLQMDCEVVGTKIISTGRV